MRLVSITPARNESWVLGFSLRAMLRWVDEAVVLVHASNDETMDIVQQVQRETGRVTIIEESDQAWKEMNHRHRLLEQARCQGATHIAIVDADEVLCSNLWEWARHQTESLPPGSYMQIQMRQLWDGIGEYAVSAPSRHGRMFADWGQSVTTVSFADTPQLHWAPKADGYHHHHREPYGARSGASFRIADGSGLMHLQFADARRLRAKHAAYKIKEALDGIKPIAEIEAMYNLAILPASVKKAPVPAEWMAGYKDILGHLKLGEVPWHEQWCRERVAEFGATRFSGLNLFGVV
jgi:hypothetical protein